MTCARCRAPLTKGMRVSIFHPDVYRRYAESAGLRAYDDNDPIIVCPLCAPFVERFDRETRPQ